MDVSSTGYVAEVFRSIQGEGPRIGEMHAFVRLYGCTLGCAYCDTGAAAVSGPECGPASFHAPSGVSEIPNPVGADEVAETVRSLDDPAGVLRAVSFTGGEPLEQPGFVEALAGRLRDRLPVMLETNGLHHAEMRRLAGYVDMVSVDIKLPSATGLGPLWDEHREFLQAVKGVEAWVKAVVGPATPDSEVAKAAGLVAETLPVAMFVIQPLTSSDGMVGVPGSRLLEMYLAAARMHRDVRVIPQAHVTLGVM